jgi:hypothetical protein
MKKFNNVTKNLIFEIYNNRDLKQEVKSMLKEVIDEFGKENTKSRIRKTKKGSV